MLLLAVGCTPSGDTTPTTILLASPTTLQDSGLLDALLPVFEERTGYRVKALAVGTGEALAMARRGDVDVLLGHAPALEREAAAEGAVLNRRLVMTNDFLLVGPAGDPAGVIGDEDVTDALGKIRASRALFVSRGDGSGTHQFELGLWNALGVTPPDDGYLETGQGMGATLQVANQLDAYTLVDRGTFLAYRDRIALRPAVVGDPRQLNVYSVMVVAPERSARINGDGARALSDFLIAPETQGLIGDFGRDHYGETLYRAAAGRDERSLSSSSP